MIVSTIKQFGLKLRADPEEIPFQHSANIQMKFIRAPDYEDYKVMGFYQAPGDPDSSKLDIDDEGIFNLGAGVFKRRGTLRISFALYKNETIIHLGDIEYEIRNAIGDTNATLPADEKVWMELVKREVDEYLKDHGGTTNIDFADKRDIEEIIENVFIGNE